MDSRQYANAAIDTVQKLPKEDGQELKTSKKAGGTHGALNPNYQPELDATPECDAEHASRYLQIIGILRWAIELGRYNILLEDALMSQYQANPRIGPLEAEAVTSTTIRQNKSYLIQNNHKSNLAH